MTEILGENNEFRSIFDNDEKDLYSGLKELITNECKLQYYRQKAKERSSLFMLVSP